MAKNNDPFAGILLSEQASPDKLDQRLFSSEPQPSPPPKESKPPKAEQTKPPTKTVVAERPPAIRKLKPTSLTATRFDLDDLPLYKASYLFTSEELEALEDLKLKLRRELDTKVTKNDLIRCALHMLVEDYSANGERSYASRKVRRRATR